MNRLSGKPRILFSPDTGGSTGQTSTASGNAGDQTGVSAQSQDKGDQQQTKTAGAGEGGAPAGKTVSAEEYSKLRADFDNMLTVHTEMKHKEEARKTEAMKEQGKYEELYKTTDSELQTLKPRLERAEKAVNSFLESELKTIPENLKFLIPEGDPASRLDWISKARESGILTIATKTSTATGDGSPAPTDNIPKSSLTSLYRN